ncbi:aldo/keto reductase family protein [Sarocladium implicatum]|nr:aldo/keto reductase family protein [Sarocladium implicatum]
MSAANGIPSRQLGKNGPMVPALGLGTMGFTFSYGKALSDEEIFAILDRAYELGCRFWDTADFYNGGEVAIGKWFKRTGKRDEIFLATKFGFLSSGEGTGPWVDTSPEHCKEACEQSLKDLGVDVIDLYYQHIVDEVTPVEKTMEALLELQKQGKIKHIGLTNGSASCIRRAAAVAPIVAYQAEYSIVDREIEGTTGPQKDILATCREFGISIVAYAPLGRGILTPNHAQGQSSATDQTDIRGWLPRFSVENQKHNAAILSQLETFAEKKGCTVAQLAIAWLLKQEDDGVFVIPGTRRITSLEQNCEAATAHGLTDGEAAEIRKFVESVKFAGEAYPHFIQSLYYRDSKALDA